MNVAVEEASDVDRLVGALRSSYDLQTEELQALSHLGHTKLSAGDYSGAQRLFSLIVVMAPKDVGFQIGLADASIAMGDFDMALQAAAVVIALSPLDPRGYFISGRACLGLGLPAEAREDLSDAIQLADQPDMKEIRLRAERLLALSERS